MEETSDIPQKNLNSLSFTDPVSKKWAFEKFYEKLPNNKGWIEIYFNHQKYNGVQMKEIYTKNYESIEAVVHDKINNETVDFTYNYDGDDIILKFLKEIPIKIKKNLFYGKLFKTKEIIKFFHMTLNQEFYIPIDMSHVFKQTMLLRLKFSPLKSFEENWTGLVRIKKNENNFLFENDKWKEYLKPSRDCRWE